MERHNVNSSDLSSIGYNKDNQVLEIEFINGSIYRYFQVPLDMFTSLLNAGSHGKFFNQNIKDKYDYSKA